jgi:hypothetical protein
MSVPDIALNDGPSAAPPRGSKTTLILMLVTIFAVFFSWRSCWYGAPLTDAQIEAALKGEKGLQDMQRALNKVDELYTTGDRGAARFLPLVLPLAKHENAAIRKSAAWVMGDAKGSRAEVSPILAAMLADVDAIVRGQAALALANHGDAQGRGAITALLEDYKIVAPAEGKLSQSLRKDEPVRSGVRAARIEPDVGAPVDVLSPLEGAVRSAERAVGSRVKKDDVLMTVTPGEGQVTNALVGLFLVGTKDDAAAVARVLESNRIIPESTRRRAEEVKRALEKR